MTAASKSGPDRALLSSGVNHITHSSITWWDYRERQLGLHDMEGLHLLCLFLGCDRDLHICNITMSHGKQACMWVSLGKNRLTWWWHPSLHGSQGKQLWHLCHTHKHLWSRFSFFFWVIFAGKTYHVIWKLYIKNGDVPSILTLVKYVQWICRKVNWNMSPNFVSPLRIK